MAEKTISLANVDLYPIQKPLIPFNLAISTKLWDILSALPTISCCFTTSKGFLTILPKIYAQIEAQTLRKTLSFVSDLTVQQVQKKVKEQGNDTVIWQENPLKRLFAMEVKFSPGDEPIIRVFMVYSGQKTMSTAIPAKPPAIPCLKSAIIIIDQSNQQSSAMTCPNFHIQLARQSFSLGSKFLFQNRRQREPQLRRICLSAFQSSGYTYRKAWIFSIFCCLASRIYCIIIIMQHPTLTLIIRYPNDTLRLATQDHLKDKVLAKCQACGRIEAMFRSAKEMTCKNCGVQRRIEAPKGQNCRKQNCNGELKLMMMATGMMTEQCSVCDYRQILNLR